MIFYYLKFAYTSEKNILLQFAHMKYTEKNYNAYFFSNRKKEPSMYFGMLSLIFTWSTSATSILYVCDLRTILILHNREETLFINTNYSSMGY